jgi:hypothetical protein
MEFGVILPRRKSDWTAEERVEIERIRTAYDGPEWELPAMNNVPCRGCVNWSFLFSAVALLAKKGAARMRSKVYPSGEDHG